MPTKGEEHVRVEVYAVDDINEEDFADRLISLQNVVHIVNEKPYVVRRVQSHASSCASTYVRAVLSNAEDFSSERAKGRR